MIITGVKQINLSAVIRTSSGAALNLRPTVVQSFKSHYEFKQLVLRFYGGRFRIGKRAFKREGKAFW